MKSSGTLPVREYLSACEVLLHETELAMTDLDIVRGATDRPMELRHVVDFSEVFAYTFPHKTLGPMRIFGDENPRNIELLQRDALDNLFFHAASPAIILPPHAAEMQRQIAKLRMGFFNELVRTLDEASKEIERAAQHPEVRDLISRIQNTSELGEVELREALGVFERHATSVLLLHRMDGEAPLDKMMRLARERRIVPLPPSLLNVEPHQPTWDRWYDRLREDRLTALDMRIGSAEDEQRRGEIIATSETDAMAIGQLYTLNHMVDPSVRYLFVTRSKHMHNVFDEELKQGLWEHDIFRHPRSFNSIFLRHELRPTDRTDTLNKRLDDHSHELRNRRASLELLISGTRPRLEANEPLERDETFVQHIGHIRHDWELSGVLASAGRDAQSSEDQHRRVRDVVQLLTDRRAFTTLLSKRLDQLMESVEGHQAFLAFYAQSSARGERTALEHAIHASLIDEDQAILTTRRYWVPHVIEFTSPELTEWARSLEQQHDIKWEDITEFLRQTFSAEAEYERLLAMAYLLASLKKWSFAERFCHKAILLTGGPHLFEHVMRHEAYFFLAVCLRMDETANRSAEALSYLDQATRTRNLRLGVSKRADLEAERDPRYLIERANHIYRWNELYDRSPQGTKPSQPRERALQLWEQALEVAGDNSRVRAQIHNNICFYYCVAKRPNVAKIRHHLGQLIAALGAPSDKWPPLMIDTLAVARLRLFQSSGDGESRRELVDAQKLLSKIRKTDLLDAHRKTIEKHLAAINTALSQLLDAPPPAETGPSPL